jgi:hypothetical protein
MARAKSADGLSFYKFISETVVRIGRARLDEGAEYAIQSIITLEDGPLHPLPPLEVVAHTDC